MMKKLLSLFVSVLLLLSACSQGESVTQGDTPKITLVKVEKVVERYVDQTIEFTGNIEPLIRNNISSAAAQRIEKIHVDVGSEVKRGQLLVEMEDINYSQARIQLENLKTDLSRIEALYDAGGVSRQQYDQLATQVKVMEESIANLAKNTKLLSPISGIVTQRNFDSGDVAGGQPILVVMQIEPVKILINISEEFYPQVKVGTPASIKLDIYPDKEFSGRVMLVHPTIDAMTRSFQAELRIENPSLLIRPGMFARAIVDFGSKERVTVSDISVIKHPGTNDRYVFVVDDNRVEYRKIELGRRVNDIYEVKSGLEVGEVVVMTGHTGLMDGSLIEITTGGVDLTQ